MLNPQSTKIFLICKLLATTQMQEIRGSKRLIHSTEFSPLVVVYQANWTFVVTRPEPIEALEPSHSRLKIRIYPFKITPTSTTLPVAMLTIVPVFCATTHPLYEPVPESNYIGVATILDMRGLVL